MKNKAVILGSNYFIGLSIIRSLGRNSIYTVAIDYSDKNCYGAKSKYLNEHLIAPHYKENEREFLDFLLNYGKKQDAKPVLFPSADAYVELIDKHFDVLKEHYLFNMKEKELWSTVIDKEKLHKLAVEHNVLVPETINTRNENYISKVKEEIQFPCIVKPIDSPSFMAQFKTKMFMCNNIDEVRKYVDKANQEGIEVIVQRIIPGFDDNVYTYDAYVNQETKISHWITCQKQRQFPIHFGASVYTKQKYVEELHIIGSKFLQDIGYNGFGEIEFKKDEISGKFYLIEINARTTTLNSMLEKCGINFPLITYSELIGDKIGEKKIDFDIGMAWTYMFEDLLAIKEYLKLKELKKTKVLKSLLSKKVSAIWVINDPLPAFYFNKMILKKIYAKLLRK